MWNEKLRYILYTLTVKMCEKSEVESEYLYKK